MDILRWIKITLFTVLLAAGGMVLDHRRQRTHSMEMPDALKQPGKWIAIANVLEAEAITGHSIPSSPDLFDVISFGDIHEFYFADWNSRQTITVRFADSHPKMTFIQMMSIRNSFVQRAIAQQDRSGAASQARGSTIPKIVGHKQFALSSGEIINADRILVRLPKGGTSEGMQVRLIMNGKVFHIIADGEPFIETRFVDFLNAWRSTPSAPKVSDRLTQHEKSIAYTKRGELLAQLTFRRSEALEYLQKAIQFDPKNSEALLQLQSLATEMQRALEVEETKH